jgi:hypothetical protein
MIPVLVNNQLVGIFEIIKDLTESKKIEEYPRKADKISVIYEEMYLEVEQIPYDEDLIIYFVIDTVTDRIYKTFLLN